MDSATKDSVIKNTSTSLMNMSMDAELTSGNIKSWNNFGGLGLDEVKTVYYHWYPNYQSTHIWQPDTFSQAFKVVSMMIEKEYLKGITLKKFIKIVKEVEEKL